MIFVRCIQGKQVGDENPTMKIGNNNVFEVASIVESQMIGDNNVLECRSK